MGDAPFRLMDLLDDMWAGEDVFFRFVRVAEDIMATDVKTLTLDDTVEAAFQFMKENKIRHAPVMLLPSDEDGEEAKPQFVGVISERDLFRQVSPYWGTLAERDEDAKGLRKHLVEVVTRKPETVSPDTPMPDVIRIMTDHRVDMVPVLAGKDLVGVITVADMVRVFVILGKVTRLCREEQGKTRRVRVIDVMSKSAISRNPSLEYVAQTVEDIMTEDVACLGPRDTVGRAMEVMQTGRCRHVPIVDAQRKVLGIISDRDVLLNLPLPGPRPQNGGFRERLFAVEPKDPSLAVCLEEVMKRKVLHVSPGCGVYDAASKLYGDRISCLPVIDEESKIRGIVTVTDLMRSMLAAYSMLAKYEA